MLCFKAWLEVRARFLFALALVMAPILGMWVRGPSSGAGAGSLLMLLPLTWMFGAIFLAGNGIRTQSALQGVKGLHGSTQFTLSLPISRAQLMATRAAVGLGASLTVVLLSTFALWIAVPAVRAIDGGDIARWVAAGTGEVVAAHAIAILSAAILDEYWYVWGALSAFGSLHWLTTYVTALQPMDLLRATGEASPVVTHAPPWSAMAACYIIAACSFGLATRVAKHRQF